jgi:BirA family biotin operon repressor/biotin-[acetyl-CoA-carboxylase] ligase
MGDVAAGWDVGRIARELGACRFGRPLEVREVVVSTIDEAWRAAEAGAGEGWAMVAEQQTRGRGRAGRVWHSPRGVGIWLSLLLRPAAGWDRLGPLPLVAGVAVARACESAGACVHIKWPNDLIAPDGSGRKLGGVLAESRSSGGTGAIVLSVGLDVEAGPGDFPPGLAERVTTLSAVAGRPVERSGLLAGLLRELECAYDELSTRGAERLLEEWRRRSAILGRVVSLREGVAEVAGVARDVEPDGALVVRLESGAEMVVRAGEVEVRWEPRRSVARPAGGTDGS